MVRIAAVGTNTFDIYRDRNMMYPGGNAYNIAYHVRSLGGESAYVGVLSRTASGWQLKRILMDASVDVSFCVDRPGSGNYAVIEFDDGDRRFSSWNTDSVVDRYPVDITPALLAYLGSYDLVCVSNWSRLPSSAIQRLAEGSLKLSYDFSDGFTPADLRFSCPLIRVGFFSASHIREESLVRDILSEAFANGCPLSVATLGSRGSLAYDGHTFYRQANIDEKRVDTMGAGDSYIASFLFQYLKGKDIRKAMAFATSYATHCITVQGSLGFGYPFDIQDLDSYFFQEEENI